MILSKYILPLIILAMNLWQGGSKARVTQSHRRNNVAKTVVRKKLNFASRCDKIFCETFLEPLLTSPLLPVKGAFALRKKIVKVSFVGVAMCRSSDVWELQCLGVAVSGSCGVWELQCGGVAVWRSCGVG